MIFAKHIPWLRHWMIARGIRRIIGDVRSDARWMREAYDANPVRRQIAADLGNASASTMRHGRYVASVGRQSIAMPDVGGPFGAFGRPEVESYQIPDGAQCAKWEAKHLFPAHAKLPTRTAYGLHCSEPPLAYVCAECELKQPPLPHGARRCPYCGVTAIVHGTFIYWFRQHTPEVQAWSPRR